MKSIETEFAISERYTAVVLKQLEFGDKKIFSFKGAEQENQDEYLEVIKDIPEHSLVYMNASSINTAR
ncbi:hypothetical protein [Holospora curviuscula]|uniref:hypothetical protein n=1 Tax=Holospora curviuscula TaxID=1082868 RepID=UPI00101AE0A9|nr:hypothetical protein [Holospora curviuscula]